MNNVIDIEELRITRDTRNYRPPTECQHKKITLDSHGETIHCGDCGKQLSAWWTLNHYIDAYRRARDSLIRREDALKEAAAKAIHTKAAQDVEKAWRSRTMAPYCPHCREAIFPTDGFGRGLVNKAIALRRREALAAQKATP
jgi:hypothetical protein